MKTFASFILVLLFASISYADPISIYTVAGANTYQNTTNNPCVFFGPGGSGCNQNPAGWSTVGDTGGGDPFNPYPLTNTYGDAPGELALFGTNVGRDFYLGLDINDTSQAQTLDNLTVNFLDTNGATIKSYTFAPPLGVPNSNNGLGFADYILTAGCSGVTTGSGASAMCTNYTPFSAPLGTRQINFTFGLTNYNDGPDKLFLISKPGSNGQPTPFDEPPASVPDTASTMSLFSIGMMGLTIFNRRRASN